MTFASFDHTVILQLRYGSDATGIGSDLERSSHDLYVDMHRCTSRKLMQIIQRKFQSLNETLVRQLWMGVSWPSSAHSCRAFSVCGQAMEGGCEGDDEEDLGE